jgi:hypothetical protein
VTICPSQLGVSLVHGRNYGLEITFIIERGSFDDQLERIRLLKHWIQMSFDDVDVIFPRVEAKYR